MFTMEAEMFPVVVVCCALLCVVHYNNARDRNKLLRKAIIPPDDGSFTTVTGVNRETFEIIHTAVFSHAPHLQRRGRKCLLSTRDKLGLYLMYIGSRMKLRDLCLLFGITPSTASEVVRHMIDAVVVGLEKHPAAKVCFPDENEMKKYAKMVENREPSVKNVIGFVDGLSIPTQCSSDELEQSAHYNGYYHDTAINNVFAFAPTGKIIHASVNFPGSWHDTNIASQSLINLCIRKLGEYCLCVDQGFPRSGELADKFVGQFSKKSRRKLAPVLRVKLLQKAGVYVKDDITLLI